MKRFIFGLILGLCAVCIASAQENKKASSWVVEQTTIIPQSVQINEGTTRNGNPKCWIVIEDMKVSVSPSNAAKFKAGEVNLELVKWRNSETNKVRYSTRQAGGRKSPSSSTKDLDLKSLFK